MIKDRIIEIKPLKGWVPLNLKELWEYRELFYFIVWKDFKIRYKQTAIGLMWVLIQPFFSMVVFSIFFGKLAGVPSDGLPYPIFNYAALVPWTFFANSLMQASTCLAGQQGLIKKIYFPRLILPISTVLANSVNFFITFSLLIVMMIYYHIYPTIAILLLPLFFLIALITSIGVSLWFCAIDVWYRDVERMLPFIIQFWLFITPIVYSSSLLKEPWRSLYGLNPMAGVIEGFRWALLGTPTAPGIMIIISSCCAILVLIGGAYFFRRMEKGFADVL